MASFGQPIQEGAKKILNVKVHFEDHPRRIQATYVKEENGHLLAFNGGQKVADIPQDRIEFWSLDSD